MKETTFMPRAIVKLLGPNEILSGRMYLLLGLCFFLVKYIIDSTISYIMLGRPWSPWHYLTPGAAVGVPIGDANATFFMAMLVVSIPFILIGICLNYPQPMKEWSPFADIHPPHLDDFLVSKGGQFHLIALPDGTTQLEGTTWYQHHMWPAGYWRLWSDSILHTIHRRVLNHVKNLSEADNVQK
jgi:hypothetical protein